ncbi:hypothetical protein [Chromohalobacter sp. 11-W]|uniref:hypothetical protein n=1 Tax=Chromohalobacter sp. 11-W TaxID=2994061 RepID=UPI0024685C30|nr:hypothetical protein [Chromohalobacter sp. 11-W]
MKNLLAVVSMMMLVGCTSVAYNGGGNVVDRVSYPKVGEVVTAQVGDHLVEKGSLVKEGVLKVNQRVDGFLYDIPAQAYRQVGADSENDFYGSVGVTRNPLADPVQALAVAKEDDAQVCVISTFGASNCYNANYDKTSRLSVSDDGFKQTLIYNGRVGDRINIGYREFSNNSARPAFNNEVEYDLSSSHRIGYKGASIEVLEAGNNSITYRLISNFPD